MDAWHETLGVVLVAALGVYIGRWISNFRKPYWSVGYVLPFILIGILLLVRFFPKIGFQQPFYWIVNGRSRFVILSLVATIGLTAPLSRLKYTFEKIAVFFAMTLIVFCFGVLPFVVPAFINKDLSNIQTRMDASGICYQTTPYTCGPAAAVTALGRLGISAEEGQIAVLSHSTPVTGTLPGCLSRAINEHYGNLGLKCRYRHFDSIRELQEAGNVLVIIKDSLLSDHCVAVLGVEDGFVNVADPVYGKVSFRREEFEKIWRFCGIVLDRS